MVYDLETILNGIALVPTNAENILDALAPAWTERCVNLSESGENNFCFVWKAKDAFTSSGMMYRRNMVRDYLGDKAGADIEQIIDETDHATEIAVVLLFGTKAHGFRIAKRIGTT